MIEKYNKDDYLNIKSMHVECVVLLNHIEPKSSTNI